MYNILLGALAIEMAQSADPCGELSTPPTAGSPSTTAASSPNPAIQLREYKQKLQLMNQQLRAGQQMLRKLRENPSPSQAQKVAMQ